MKRIQIKGVNIDDLNVNETVKLVEEYIIQKKPLHLMGVNADKINQCLQNKQLMDIVNNCEIINADGASVVLASRFLGKGIQERVAGIDLMLKLIGTASIKKYSIYLLGAKQEVVEETANELKSRFEDLNIVGIRNGYFDDSQWNEVLIEIEKKKPDIVFVGITSPKKEYLIDYFQKNGSNSIYMGVGGSFDVISGNIKRAPVWLQKANLEWFYRMCQEPRRLFGRYFVGNSKFIIGIIKEKINCEKNTCN
ncbi:WecB/TagA/CpsF family glycosyltransferase [Amedibacillus sp. YH-ame10]